MGCSASVQSVPSAATLEKNSPTAASKRALAQIRKIDKTAPRKRLEDKGSFQLRVQNTKVNLPFAYVSQTGYYPDELDKANQDSLVVRENLGSKNNELAFFGVFDGHGKTGDLCSNFVRMELWENLENDEKFREGEYYQALVNAHVRTNEEMHEQERMQTFSDMMSGTTAISALFEGDKLFVSNVGDSRAIAIVEHDDRLVSVPLSIDQTPFRKDERERVKECGARVLTMAQIEGLQDPEMDDYGDEEDNDGDPPRLWCHQGNYPGTAFTRSLGDRVAESIGVHAIPEILERQLTTSDQYILLASDGVFEFITSQGVVDIFSRFEHDLLNAARAIVAEAYRQWLQFETRTDDITCIIIDVRGIGRDQVKIDELLKRKGSFGVEFLAQEIRSQLHKHVSGEDIHGLQDPKYLSKISENPDPSKLVHLASFRLDQATSLEPKAVTETARSEQEATSHFTQSFMSMELRPVRRKVANNVGVLHFDPSELEGYEMPIYEKSSDEREDLEEALRTNYMFAHLSDEQRSKAVSAMEKIEVTAGQVVIKQFDKGDKFYVAASGRYAVEVSVNKMTEDMTGKMVPIEGEYEEPREIMEYNCDGDGFFQSFGELALMYNKPRAATITARTDGVLWALERKAFHSVLMRDSAHRLVKVLRKVQAFKSLTYNEVARLTDLLTELRFKEGEYIVRQGDLGDSFYVIKKGRAKVTIDSEDGEEKEVMRLAEYEYFGERALINKAPRAANVVATEDVVCLMIRKELFDEVLGRLQNVLADDARQREAAAERYHNVSSLKDLKVFPGSFPIHYSTIFRAAVRATVGERANKVQFVSLRRIVVPKTDEEEDAKAQLANELELLSKVAKPTLLAQFCNEENPDITYHVYQQEFVADLASVVAERSFDSTSAMLRFSIKSIAMGLVQLQQHRGILSRGITPEGILMDVNGQLVISDFRYAKLTAGSRTFSACGTPEYMAPEVILGSGHGFAADWWSLGILLIELCTGTTPFADMNEPTMYASITSSEFVEKTLLAMSSVMEPPCLKLLKSLLVKDPESRLIFGHEDELDKVSFLGRTKLRESPFETQARKIAANLMGAVESSFSSSDSNEQKER